MIQYRTHFREAVKLHVDKNAQTHWDWWVKRVHNFVNNELADTLNFMPAVVAHDNVDSFLLSQQKKVMCAMEEFIRQLNETLYDGSLFHNVGGVPIHLVNAVRDEILDAKSIEWFIRQSEVVIRDKVDYVMRNCFTSTTSDTGLTKCVHTSERMASGKMATTIGWRYTNARELLLDKLLTACVTGMLTPSRVGQIVERVVEDKIPDFIHNTCIVATNGEEDKNNLVQASTSASECDGERVHDLRIGFPPVLCAVLKGEREQLEAQTWRDDNGCYYIYKLRPNINLAFWCMELLLNGIVVRFRLSLEHKCFVEDSTYVVNDDGSRHLHVSCYDSFHLEFHPSSILKVGGHRVEVAGTSLLHKTYVRSTESTYVILRSSDALCRGGTGSRPPKTESKLQRAIDEPG
jgi:hypothetical protein